MKQVEVDGQTYEFPDDATDAEITQTLQPQAPSVGQRVSGALGGIHRAVQGGLNYVDRGLPVDIARVITGRRPTGETPAPIAPGSTGFISPSDVNQVPRNLTEAGTQAGVLAAGPLMGSAGRLGQAVGRTALGTTGGLVGALAEGRPISLEQTGRIAAPLVGGEIIGAATPPLVKSLPYVKGAINEMQAQQYVKDLGTVNPEAAAAISGQRVQPTLRGGTTTAKINQGILGGDVTDAMSRRMDRQISEISGLSGNPRVNGPNLTRAYEAMPQLEKDLFIGPVDPQGFTLRQAQAIRSYISGPAFAQSTLGQGLSKAANQMLSGGITGEMEAAMNTAALPLWRLANRQYGGAMTLAEPYMERGGYAGLNNQMLLNRNALSDYLMMNRKDAIRRLGSEEAYNAVVQGVLGGAQPGTRDLLTPGGGRPLDALMQTIGRRTNTGASTAISAPLGTLLPNIGSQYTGRQPFEVPPVLQQALDLATQRAAQERGLGPR